MNELSSHNTGSGKGDGERSPGWRNNYPEIVFDKTKTNEGFERISPGRVRKRYGRRFDAGLSLENWDTGEVQCYTDLAKGKDSGAVTITTADPGVFAFVERATSQAGATGDNMPAVPPSGETHRCCCRAPAKHD